ncbi:hypothetical protein HPP92_003007 [Vanilla planifolia]|uniref:Uncharacterized protein n=1 Tax=Vanilla planifolia TaxID=51239 RepID=A0A835S9J6_VANPL|nr:hypothetical protein HPP92_003372 [Vanilla planifolia]KAG0502935.1 hypothetical protein HPP92_003007 [Vanilla planifolia]
MGRTEKAGDAVNLLNFAGPRSLAELRGARADGIKNIDSISSLEPESKKRLNNCINGSCNSNEANRNEMDMAERRRLFMVALLKEKHFNWSSCLV